MIDTVLALWNQKNRRRGAKFFFTFLFMCVCMSMLCIIVSLNFWPTQGKQDASHSANADQRRQIAREKKQGTQAPGDISKQETQTSGELTPVASPSVIAQVPCNSSSANSSSQSGTSVNGGNQASAQPPAANPPVQTGNSGGAQTYPATQTNGGGTQQYPPTQANSEGTQTYPPAQTNSGGTQTNNGGTQTNSSGAQAYPPTQTEGEQAYPPIQANPTVQPVTPPSEPIVQRPATPTPPVIRTPTPPATPSVVPPDDVDSTTDVGDEVAQTPANSGENEGMPGIPSPRPMPMPSITGTISMPDIEPPTFWPNNDDEGDFELPRVYWSYHGEKAQYWPVSCLHGMGPVIEQEEDPVPMLIRNIVFIFGGSLAATMLLLGSAYALKRRLHRAS